MLSSFFFHFNSIHSYLPNLQRVGKDIHIYIDQKERDDYSKRDTLADVKELLPNLTHVGGEIVIHMKEDKKFRAKRFLHIGGDISTLRWDTVSNNGYDLKKDWRVVSTPEGIREEDSPDPSWEARRLKSEKELAATQNGFIGWNQTFRFDSSKVFDSIFDSFDLLSICSIRRKTRIGEESVVKSSIRGRF